MGKTASDLRSPTSDLHLLLAGATTDDTATIEQYARTHLGSNVTILKDQPFSETPAIYQTMNLYVHPAPEEVFGICLLESMACGIPVIAHHSPRLKYVVGEGGWLVDVTKPGFLAEKWPQIESGCRLLRHVADSMWNPISLGPQFIRRIWTCIARLWEKWLTELTECQS